MKKIILIIASLILVGCVKQSSLALYAFNKKSKNKLNPTISKKAKANIFSVGCL
jgi:uncharacterized protein YxeA